eukprot:10186264-Karenia_brevis.AAC.1
MDKLRDELGTLKAISDSQGLVDAKQAELDSLVAKKRAAQPTHIQLREVERKLISRRKNLEASNERLEVLRRQLADEEKAHGECAHEIEELLAQQERIGREQI